MHRHTMSWMYRPLVPRIMSTVLAFVVKEFASSVKALQDPPENLVLQVRTSQHAIIPT